jgi:hypothetical protein
MPVILATQEADQEDGGSRPAQANSSRHHLENTQHKKGWQSGMAQGVQHLPSTLEVLSSNPSTKKKKKNHLENNFLVPKS